MERPGNMRIAVTRYTVGGSVTYSCDEHFTLHGHSKRICMMSGVWSGVAPNCSSNVEVLFIMFNLKPKTSLIINYR